MNCDKIIKSIITNDFSMDPDHIRLFWVLGF